MRKTTAKNPPGLQVETSVCSSALVAYLLQMLFYLCICACVCFRILSVGWNTPGHSLSSKRQLSAVEPLLTGSSSISTAFCVNSSDCCV